MDSKDLKEQLDLLREDINRSIQGRNRLTLITTAIGVIAIVLWVAVVALIVQVEKGC